MTDAKYVCGYTHTRFNETFDVDWCDKIIQKQEIWFVLH